ncbi:MAG TPA: serine hydrolase domain-containing protein [Vicinamibacterales bacterium]|nr:serine hydrolase domain-containing protein [Vicinamibacterales bacterium]
MRFMLALVAAGALVSQAAARGPQAGAAQASTPPLATAVDAVFARWTSETPGCAVGVSQAGAPVLARAYGMADLEHDVPNRADTIFEAGSVSKQFTAAAVLLLARDGKLSLDDPVRKHVPEVPDYGVPLTIRHMLTHTSGLRDWGSVAAIGGWPRTTRVHTHAHVLDIVSRQRALNFAPGTRYSYSNTGYNLAAIIVGRVSGMPFVEFSRKRLFEPLGMTRTSWRDDHTRIVKDRAIAYAAEGRGYSIEMPFENVHGNGGLLTTVGDLLRWNEHLHAPTIWDEAFAREQQQPGRFNDGRVHGYALGLRISTHKGVREVGHSGSTAGYRAHLVRYPDQRVSVAVLCNAGNANAGRHAQDVADLYLKPDLQTSSEEPPHRLSKNDAESVRGLYKHSQTGDTLSLAGEGETVRIDRGPQLVPRSGTRFSVPDGAMTLDLDGRTLRVTDPFGSVDVYERVERASPTPEQLRELEGRYSSDEAEVVAEIAVDQDRLVLKRRPAQRTMLLPLYADAFRGQIGVVRFHRDTSGRVTGFSVVQDRVWDMRFERITAIPRSPSAP